ncbi:MAG: hypothetical protein HYT77_01690 [Deltaproteobacteria bacterium]|nr:hypothetical protein [Deltaproteobacteria bacterium]
MRKILVFVVSIIGIGLTTSFPTESLGDRGSGYNPFGGLSQTVRRAIDQCEDDFKAQQEIWFILEQAQLGACSLEGRQRKAYLYVDEEASMSELASGAMSYVDDVIREILCRCRGLWEPTLDATVHVPRNFRYQSCPRPSLPG